MDLKVGDSIPGIISAWNLDIWIKFFYLITNFHRYVWFVIRSSVKLLMYFFTQHKILNIAPELSPFFWGGGGGGFSVF